MHKLLLFILLTTKWLSCQSTSDLPQAYQASDKEVLTKGYWYDGKAEINTFEIKQNRYDTLHDGSALMIFVSEDFLTDKQVKNDRYQSNQSTSILKKIEQRKFYTGVYDYTVYSTVFTPMELGQFKKTFKVTGSSQEWCGTIYSQLNAKTTGYQATLHSYFEAENDQSLTIMHGIPEGELYTRLRMNPELLPIGAFDIIPDPIIATMKHYPLRSFNAIASISEYEGDLSGDSLKTYTVHIAEVNRTLEILYEDITPFKIVAFYDTYPSAFDQKMRTTEAICTNRTKLDYWNKNSPSDEVLRKELKID